VNTFTLATSFQALRNKGLHEILPDIERSSAIDVAMLPSVVKHQRTIALHMLKVWWRSVYRLWWKQRKRANFCMCSSIHFLQTSHDIPMIYCTKVHKMFRKYIQGLCMGISFTIFPTVEKASTIDEGVSGQLVAVSRHIIGCYGNVPWPKFTNSFSRRNC